MTKTTKTVAAKSTKKSIVVNLKKEQTMKSKKSTAKKSAPSHRGQRAAFAFVKNVEAVQEGIQSVVLAAAKKVKSGTVAEIAAVAVKLGLSKATSQDPLVQTHVHLNRLRALKAVKRIDVAA
jgi:biopolymer transport protein ExbD